MIREILEFYEKIYDEHSRLLKDPFHRLEFEMSKKIIMKYLRRCKRKRLKVLDVGGGTGRYSVWLAKEFKNSEIKLIDIVPKHIEIAKEFIKEINVEDRVKVEVGNILDMKERDYNVILCLRGVLNHLRKGDIDKALKNLKNALRRNGILFISIINKWHRPFRYLTENPEKILECLDEFKKKEFKGAIKVLFDPFEFKGKLEKHFKVMEISALEGFASWDKDKFNQACKDEKVFEKWMGFLWKTRNLKASIYSSEHVVYVCR